MTTSLTIKPLTSVSGISSSAIKRKRELDATSETTESDEESLSRSKAPSSQHSTKRGPVPSEKMKRLKKEATSSSFIAGDQEDLDLACGETIPGSPVHPGQSDMQNSSPDQFSREATTQRLSTSVGRNLSKSNLPQIQVGSNGDKILLQDLTTTNMRSQHSPSTNKGSISKQNTNMKL